MSSSFQSVDSSLKPVAKKVHTFYRYVKDNGVREGASFAVCKARSALASWELTWRLLYEQNPFISTGHVSDYSKCAETVWTALGSMRGIKTAEWQLDAAAYHRYVARAAYEQFDPYYRGGESGDAAHRAEKLLQHFISLELLQISADDLFIDVASNTSPMRTIVQQLYGIPAFSLDLGYEPGIHGELIGADAGAMPLDAGFASKMALHCSFEHFANGSDIRFIKECGRVLRSGGKVCIIPLYLLPQYSIRIDPTLEHDISVTDPEGAAKVYVRNYQVDYGRFYDPESFEQRIVNNADGLAITVYRIRGLEDLGEGNVYSQFAMIAEKV